MNGLLIEANGDDDAVARQFAEAIEQLTMDDLARLRTNAHARAIERYSLATHADACETLFLDAAGNAPRWWPLDRACTFTESSSESIPPDAAQRAAKAIAGIKGPVAIYGAGRHTLAIAKVLAHAKVACVIDDDPKNHGTTLWGWPVVGVDRVEHGSTVLISSFMHRAAMAERCARLGLRCVDPYSAVAGDGTGGGSGRSTGVASSISAIAERTIASS